MEVEKIYKRNSLFIILIGIVGFCFGSLDWDNNLSDLVYLKYNNKFLISIISANIGTARLLASLFCIKINDSYRPNFIFSICMILCSIIAIIAAILFESELIILFVIIYLLEVLLLEVFSGYHYAYTYNSLPEKMAMIVHSKRISVFKLLQAGGIATAGFICANFIDNAFLIISMLSTLVFIIAIFFINQVKNFPKVKTQKKDNIIKKLNIFKYTKYFRKWLIVRSVGRFALASLIVLLSMRVIDNNLSLTTLKTVKSLQWILSGVGFFLSGYFIKKKIIVKGDILIKIIIVVLLPLVFIVPEFIFLIILMEGILNPFNTMSHLEMLRNDNDDINIAQKDMVINLIGYFAKMVSAYVLLNINSDIAIIVIVITLLLSAILEFKLYKNQTS